MPINRAFGYKLVDPTAEPPPIHVGVRKVRVRYLSPKSCQLH